MRFEDFRERVWVVFIAFALPLVGVAEVYKYTDDRGVTVFATSKEDIPAQFRDQVASPHQLPKISRGDFGGDDVSDSSSRPRVELYVTSWCGYCRKAESFLRKHGVAFKSYDIERSQVGRTKHRKAGGGGIPVIKIGDTIVRGYNEGKLRKLLDL